MIFSALLSVALLYSVLATPTTNFKTTEDSSDIQASEISTYYVPTPGIGTYKLHKLQRKNWNNARNTCLNEGAHLLVINSEEERAVIVKLLNDNKINEEIWMGIHELFKKDEWVSVKDQRIDAIGYIYWRPGEPNNFQNQSEHCLVINQAGMNDQNCDKEFFFVCEI